MRYKATFLLGFAAGYVLGSRAGRQRYEQIRRMSHTVTASPVVQHTTDAMQAQAAQLGTRARQALQDKAGNVSHDLRSKMTSRLGHHEVAPHTIDLDAPAYTNGAMT